jgi:hypothetical protein
MKHKTKTVVMLIAVFVLRRNEVIIWQAEGLN